MQLAFIDWVVVIVSLSIFVATGMLVGTKFLSKNQSSNALSSFFLGGRQMPWYLAGLSMVATTFAADTPLAVTELVAKNGISGNWLWWSFVAGGLFTAFFFAKLWRRANILTELEFIELRYGGKPAKFLRRFKAIYLGLFLNLLVIGWVNLAMQSLLTTFFGITDLQALFAIAGIIFLSVIYTANAGLIGISVADSIQFVLAMVGCVILAAYVISSDEVGGISGLQNTLSPAYFDYFPSIGNAANAEILTLTVGSFLAFIGVQWWASWYPGQEPGGGGYVAQRIMGTKSEKDAVFATLFFQVAHYCLRPWPWILVALASVAIYSPEFASSAIDPSKVSSFAQNPRLGYVFAMTDFLPVGLKGLLLVAFLAAYMSTISTQLNWGASYLVNDFLFTYSNQESNQKQLFAARGSTVFLAVLGLLITPFLSSISAVWEFILECGAGLGLVLILRWFWWRINAYAEIAATMAPFFGYGISHFILVPLLGDAFANQKGTYLFTILFTTISWLLVMYATPAESKEKLLEFYNRVRPSGWWTVVNTEANTLVTKTFKNQLALWGMSVTGVYALLFAIGDLLFSNLARGTALIGLSTLCIAGIARLLKREGS